MRNAKLNPVKVKKVGGEPMYLEKAIEIKLGEGLTLSEIKTLNPNLIILLARILEFGCPDIIEKVLVNFEVVP